MSDDSIELLNKFKDGDEAAATQLFDRYVNRLLALAGSRLSETMRRRVEPEDVVQSAYRSFFRNVRADRYDLVSGQLWGLLAAITINKVKDRARFHTAQKRTVSAEQSTQTSRSCYGLVPRNFADEPTIDQAIALQEQLEQVLAELPSLKREILELYLQNMEATAIAKEVRRSERTVCRTLEEIRSDLEEKLQSPD